MIKFEFFTKETISAIVNLMVAFYNIDGYPINKEKTIQLFHYFIINPQLGSCFTINYNNQICGYMLLIPFFSFKMNGLF